MRGIVTSISSLLLFALRQWGLKYKSQHYSIFAFQLAMTYYKNDPESILPTLTPESLKNGEMLDLIHRPRQTLTDSALIEEEIAQAFVDIMQQ